MQTVTGKHEDNDNYESHPKKITIVPAGSLPTFAIFTAIAHYATALKGAHFQRGVQSCWRDSHRRNVAFLSSSSLWQNIERPSRTVIGFYVTREGRIKWKGE